MEKGDTCEFQKYIKQKKRKLIFCTYYYLCEKERASTFRISSKIIIPRERLKSNIQWCEVNGTVLKVLFPHVVEVMTMSPETIPVIIIARVLLLNNPIEKSDLSKERQLIAIAHWQSVIVARQSVCAYARFVL